MAKLETQTWQVNRLSRFELRVTPKKLYIDRINLTTGSSEVAMYVQVQEHWQGGKKYFASMPTSSYTDSGTSIESIVRFISDRFDIEINQDAIDLFESRNMMRDLSGT